MIYPFLFAVYPILFLYGRNRSETPLAMLPWPIAAALGLAALLWAAGRVLLRDTERASLATAASLAVFFGYGHVYSAVAVGVARSTHDANPARFEEQIHSVVALVAIFLLLMALRGIRHARPQTLAAWSPGLTVCGWTLIALAVGTPLLWGPAARTPTAAVRPTPAQQMSGAPIASSRLGYLPDVYQIVLDGYARRDVLARHYQFDNRPFLAALAGQGFDIAERSTANFNWTLLSLASMLNMRYVTDLEQNPGRYATDRGRAYWMLRDNEVARFLKQRGYATIHFDSTWAGTLENPFADEEIACADGWFQDNFYRALAESSMLRLWRSRISEDIARCHLAQMLALERIPSRPGPKFVFAHFIPPHHPYLFDREGNILRRATVADQFQFNLGLWARRDLYRDQLIYMNGRMLGIVQGIVSGSDRPPIIILHSDHGPQLLRSDGQPEADHANARFANLLAVSGPDSAGLIPEDVSLVNVYRILLNHYFDAGLPMLPAEHYFSPFEQPYAFEAVKLGVPAP